MNKFLAIAVAAGLLLTACTTSEPDVVASPVPSASVATAEPSALRPFYEQKANWEECGQFECTTVEAPLDYDDAGADRIELALLRRPADNPDERLGSLFVNPGGPGVSGNSYAELAEVLFTQPVLEHFDIVGWDPRGVGDSTSISCMSDAETDVYYATDGTPDTAAEVRELVRLNDQFTEGCVNDDATLIPELGTFNSARDLDILRSALGEQRLNYFGASYGTELGAIYSELFPKRVGRLVLDAALDPAVSSEQLSRGQLRGFQQASEAFIDDCIGRQGCAIGPTRAEAEQQLLDLLASIDQAPLTTESGRPLTESLATTGMISAMYSESSGWPSLRLGLSQAVNGDGTVLLALADAYAERTSDGTYGSNVNSAFPAISCTDRPGTSSVSEVKQKVPTYQQISPIFGRTFAWGAVACRDWPVKAGEFPTKAVAEGADPIVVIGTTRDPATPYDWSVSLAKSLQNGVLVSRDGDGHTGYNAGNSCVDDAVDRYLVSGEIPDDPTIC
ncbi:MAG: alpha/beta hydrolase [Actinomycetes bacterium]